MGSCLRQTFAGTCLAASTTGFVALEICAVCSQDGCSGLKVLTAQPIRDVVSKVLATGVN